MMTFDDFRPGTALGECDFAFDEEAVSVWSGLFPEDRRSLPAMPVAMIAMVVMRAYMAIMKDRPPGNVHAGQKFWIARLPQLNDRLTTRLHCLDKERRNDRRWVTFASETTDGAGAILFRGRMTTIWAA